MTEQIGLHINMTANMSVVTAQMQALTAGVMETTAAYRMLDRSMDNIKFQDANRQFSNLLTSSGQFNARMVTLQTSTEGYGKALEAGRVSGRKLWSESLGYVRKQSGEIRALAREQVAFSRSQMMMTGRLASGAATATVFTPAGIGKDQVSQMQLANKEWEIFNRNAQLGSTAMVNWGKNTQWAGRQLMVGFTIPLMIMGGMAAKTFKELDQELVRLQKVYGSGLTFGDDFKKQSEMIREEGKRMASELAAAYGQAGTETVALMADLAAAGYEGENLTKLTTATTKLSLLGEIDKQEAMKATISLQTAFGLSTDQVAEKVLFLNAVENQTSTSLQDLVEAIPRAGTVIEGLGGSVEDLALYMTAFREGGVSAAEGANALKSGLSSIIAPPKAAVEFMQEFGINLPKMVKTNAGDLTGTLMAFQTELQKLDDLAQQQVITKLFGKYQFARMNAFFNNLGAQGSQTQKVLELMGYTTEELGQIANQELESITESVSGKFNRAWESFKVNLAEVGEVFLKVGTVALDVFNKVFGFFQGKDILRNIVLGLAGVAAVIGPIIMSMGLFGNMLGMMIKGILRLTNAFKVMGSGGGIKRSFELLTAESMASNASIDALTNNMFDQQKADKVLADANKWLAETYEQIASSAGRASVAVMQTADSMRMASASAAAGVPSELLAKSARAKSMGLALSTRRDNAITAAEGHSVSAERMMKMPENKLAGWGTQMAIIQAVRDPSDSRLMSPTKPGKQLGLTELQRATTAAKAGDTAELNAIAKQNRAVLQSIYDTELADLRANREEYILRRKILEVDMQTAKGWAQASGTSKQVSPGAGMLAAEIGGYNRGQINRPESLFSDTVVDFNAGALDETAAASEHVTAAMMSTEEDLLFLSESQRKLAAMNVDVSAETERVGVALVRNVAEQNGYTITIEQATAIVKKFMGTSMTADQALKTLTGQLTTMSGKGLTEKALRTLNAAILETAGDLQNVELREVQAAEKRLVAAMDSSGRVIAGTAFEIGAGGAAKATDAADAISALENATEDQIVMSEKLSDVQANHTDSVATDTVATKKHTTATEASAGSELVEVGANELSTNSELKETAANNMSSGGSVQSGGFMNYMKSNKSMMAGGALMGGAMLGSMLLPQSPISDVANMTMMGAGVGGMFGPWGMAIGGTLGLVGGGLAELLEHTKAEAKKKEAEEKARITAMYSEATLVPDLNSILKQDIDKPKQLAYMSMQVPDAVVSQSKKISDFVSERYKSEIESLKVADNALTWLNRFVNSAVAAGGDAEEAARIAAEIARQAGKSKNIVDIYANLPGGRKEARQRLDREIRQNKKSAFATMISPEAPTYTVGGFGGGGNVQAFAARQVALRENAAETGQIVGEVFVQELNDAIESGLVNSDPATAQALLEKQVNQIIKGAAANIDISDIAANTEKLAAVGIDTYGKSVEDILKEIVNLGPEARNELLRTGDVLTGPLAQGALVAEGGTIDLAHAYRDSLGPEFQAIVGKAEILEGALGGVTSALYEAEMAARQFNISNQVDTDIDKFTNMDLFPDTQPVNIEKYRSNLEDQADAMQEAATKREEAMQDEIDKVSAGYDKEIEKIQEAEAARQRAFEKEQQRFARRQEMRNLELSYQEAVAGGDLFEAARIRMDIAATRKQRAAEDANERQANKSEKKIAALEKERDKKIKMMEDALEAEQEANQKALESFQESIDAKVKAQEKANKEMVDNQQRMNDLQERMRDALLSDDKAAFEKAAKQLGISTREQSIIYRNAVLEELGDLPKMLERQITEAIAGGNWKLVQRLLDAAINGATTDELQGILNGKNARGYDNPKTDAQAGYDVQSGFDSSGQPTRPVKVPHGAAPAYVAASGGYISGPGGPTTDSIPAWLSNGEYVVRASAVKKLGKSNLDKINNGQGIPEIDGGTARYAKGGLVGGLVGGMIKSLIDSMKNRGYMFGAPQGPMMPGQGASAFGLPGLGGAVSGTRSKIVEFVADQLGESYVFGASGPNSWDCSGLTMMAYALAGKTLPHAASQQYLMSQRVQPQYALPGDLVFFNPGTSGAPAGLPGHVGIMTGGSRFIHAANPDLGVVTGDLKTTGNEFVGVGRIPGLRSGGKINYDNTLANLHRGETVLTAPLTNKLEQAVAGAGNAEYNINVTINNPSDEIDIERALLNVMSKNERRMGRNRVIR